MTSALHRIPAIMGSLLGGSSPVCLMIFGHWAQKSSATSTTRRGGADRGQLAHTGSAVLRRHVPKPRRFLAQA
jgi:hypothetical protein